MIYTNHFYPENFKINEVTNWLVESGYSVHVITGWPNYPRGVFFKGYGPFRNSFEKIGKLSIRRLPLIPRGRGSKIRLLLNYSSYFVSTLFYTLFLILFKRKYDNILVHHTSPFFIAFSAAFYKKFRKSNSILWDLDIWPHTLVAMGIIKSKFLISILENIIGLTYKTFNLVLVGSKSFESIAKKRIKKDKIVYFPNWADSKFEKIQLPLNIPKKNGKIIITYTGNLGKAQALDIVIDAIKKSNNKNLEFNFIGSGRDQSRLKQLVKENSLNHKINFFSYMSHEDLIPFLCKTHYFFLSLKNDPIFHKTVPAKLQSYLALGKPIISSISGETKKLLCDNNCGPNADAGDGEELKKIFKEINKISVESYNTFSKNSSSLYDNMFSSKERKKQILNKINSLRYTK